ncbi:MAG: hypothetical protein U0840_18590 [Gemmataceae bacterium]
MATTYTQTIEFNVWKEHTCSCCGSVYRYLFKRKMTGEGGTPEVAAQNAEKAVERALQKEVDMRACPECGHFQPDMIAAQRSSRHWWTFFAALPIYGLLLILVLTDIMTYGTAGVAGAVAALGILAANALICLGNPNSNCEANRKASRRMEKDGDLWVPEDRQPKEMTETPVGTGVGPGQYLCLGLIGVSAVAFALPFLARVLLGMTSNPGWYPEVAGPGDTPYVYFSEKLSSVKAYWNGNPRVTVLNANDVGGPVTIGATSKTDSWGNTISVKSSEKNSSFTPWARLAIPADPRLAGKTLQLQIDMTVNFPKVMGSNTWQQSSQNVTQKTTLTLSAPGRGGLYKTSFWAGFVGGCALLFLGAGLLPVFSNAFGKTAHPTDIFVPGGQTPEENGDEEVRDAEAVVEEVEEPQRRGIRSSDNRRRDDDEEDDRPRRRRDDDYDDEDDRPRRRRRDD